MNSVANENFIDNDAFLELEKRLGIKIKYVHPKMDSIIERLNLMLAANDLTDVIIVWDSIMPSIWPKSSDFFAPINDVPYFKHITENPKVRKDITSNDGKIYRLPFMYNEVAPIFSGLVIRKDWLDELGLLVPTTVEEWYEALVTFKEKKVI